MFRGAVARLILSGVLLCCAQAAHADLKIRRVPFSRDTNFVASLYSNLLGRSPQASEVLPILKLLLNDRPRSSVASQLLATDEYRATAVSGLYRALLGRDAEAAVLDELSLALAVNGKFDDVRRSILISEDFFSGLSEGNNRIFIIAVFHALLDREPTDDDVEYALALLRSDSTRAAFIDAILNSSEHWYVLVRNYYKDFLGRAPSNSEAEEGVLDLARGNPESALLSRLLGSDEYYVRSAPIPYSRKRFEFYLGSLSGSPRGADISKVSIKVRWGDGRSSKGYLRPAGGGAFAIFGSHIFRSAGDFAVSFSATLGQTDASARVQIRMRPQLKNFVPFSDNAIGGVRVAAGDVTGDGVADIIVGAGPGSGPHVKVFNGLAGALMMSFDAFDPSFRGGVSVATGDVNGDGRVDIVVGALSGGIPQVKVFSGFDGSLIREFLAFDAGFSGGVEVAAGDLNGDGQAEVIAGAGPGGDPEVAVFDGALASKIESFIAFGPSFRGGVFVASGDVDGDGYDDIITGAGPGGGPHVQVFGCECYEPMFSFYAYDPSFSGGVRVAVGDVNGDGNADIITAAGPGGGPHVKVFSGKDASTLQSFFGLNTGYSKGIFVASGDVDGSNVPGIVVGTGGKGNLNIKIFRND